MDKVKLTVLERIVDGAYGFMFAIAEDERTYYAVIYNRMSQMQHTWELRPDCCMIERDVVKLRFKGLVEGLTQINLYPIENATWEITNG